MRVIVVCIRLHRDVVTSVPGRVYIITACIITKLPVAQLITWVDNKKYIWKISILAYARREGLQRNNNMLAVLVSVWRRITKNNQMFHFKEVLVKIGSGNGLAPIRRQAITWTNTDLLSIPPQGTYFNEMLFEAQKSSFKIIYLKCLQHFGLCFVRFQCVEDLFFMGFGPHVAMLSFYTAATES